MHLPLGRGAYKRSSASEPEIRLENRYFETNPTDSNGAALLARCGTSAVAQFGAGPIRRTFTKPGLFDGDLFVVSGDALYRHNGTDVTQVTGTVKGTSAPSFAWMKGIGYEYLFLADGLLLQYYAGSTHATGTLTSNTYDYSWDSRTSSADNAWQSVCWSSSLTLFVAVASGGTNRVMVSADGVTWTAHTPPSSNWESVCWSEDLSIFVAVGNDSGGKAAMTSSDGSSWSAQTTPSNGTYRSVCWASDISLFVAVGEGGLVMSSPDGVTWTAQVAASTNDWISVAWSSELTLFVAVASTGDGNRVMTSPDGINWTARVSPLNAEWSGVCWSSELALFCAASDGSAMTSADGVTWTLYDLPNVGGHGLGGYCICWSPELRLFYIAGASGGLASSPDGQTWTLRTAAAANYWRGICWSSDLFMFAAVSDTGTGNRAMTSDAVATPVIVGQVIEIGGTYYSWDTDVDNGSPDGSASAPWLAKLGADDIASLEAMANLLNYAGKPGVDFSTDLPGASAIVTAEAVAFTLTVTAIATDAASNTITTSVYLGSNVSWGGATLSGGNVHTLVTIDVPDAQKALSLISLAGYVLVSIGGTQKLYWIRPGATTIDPLDFAEKESAPDNIVDMQVVGDVAFIAGTGSTEVWYATGDGDAPFAPIQGRTYARGMVPGTAVVLSASALAFIGDDGKVYLYAGGEPECISDNGIEERIRRWVRANEGLTP